MGDQVNKAIAIILTALFTLAGCGMLPQQAYKAEEDVVLPDGTKATTGQPIYVNKDGQATASPTDADGTPNKPLMVTDINKLEALKANADKVTGALPPPFGWLAGLGVAVIGAGGIAGARSWRKKQLADAGVPPPKSA